MLFCNGCEIKRRAIERNIKLIVTVIPSEFLNKEVLEIKIYQIVSDAIYINRHLSAFSPLSASNLPCCDLFTCPADCFMQFLLKQFTGREFGKIFSDSNATLL